MELKAISKNGETILPVCFIGKNRNQEVVDWHKKVMDFYGISMNYIEWDFYRSGHGDAIQWWINQVINSNLAVDYFWFIDMDCIPTRGDFVDVLYDKIKDKQTIFGPALATNHRAEIKNHIYAAAFCLSFSKQLYLELNRPLMTDVIPRSDNSQELTWRCQEQGKIISYMWPTSHSILTEDEMKKSGNPKCFNLGEHLTYGLGTQYGDYIFHGFMQSVPRSAELFIQKCKEILSQDKKVEAIIVCKNYSDYLELTLQENKKYFDNIIVVTELNDERTKLVCMINDVECVIYDGWNKNGAVFNKGGALNFGLSKLKYNDWVVILDSDIVIKQDFRDKLTDKSKFYGSYRRFIPTQEKYKDLIEQKNATFETDFEKIEGSGCGFFQAIHFDRLKSHKNLKGYMYPDSHSAEQVDIDFLRQFCPFILREGEYIDLVRMNIELWHLGDKPGNNNFGRNEKDTFFNQ